MGSNLYDVENMQFSTMPTNLFLVVSHVFGSPPPSPFLYGPDLTVFHLRSC